MSDSSDYEVKNSETSDNESLKLSLDGNKTKLNVANKLAHVKPEPTQSKEASNHLNSAGNAIQLSSTNQSKPNGRLFSSLA